VALRLVKSAKVTEQEEPAPERFKQQKRPDEHQFRLQVDRQTKSSYALRSGRNSRPGDQEESSDRSRCCLRRCGRSQQDYRIGLTPTCAGKLLRGAILVITEQQPVCTEKWRPSPQGHVELMTEK